MIVQALEVATSIWGFVSISDSTHIVVPNWKKYVGLVGGLLKWQ